MRKLGLSGPSEFPLLNHIAAGRLERLLPDRSCGEAPLHTVLPDRRHLPIKTRASTAYVLSLLGNWSKGAE